MTFGDPITSRANARVKALRASFSGKAARPGDLLGIEGEHLLAEAVRSGLHVDTVFVRHGSEHVLQRPALAGLRAREWLLLREDVFAGVVNTGSPQAVAAVVPIPEPAAADLRRYQGTVMVLESLQDPGNFGAILRSAEAFGVRQILVTPETVSVWNPKVVRSSAGSVFRVPVARMPLLSAARLLSDHGYKLWAAVAGAEGALPLPQCDLSGRCALLVGNEGAGLSPEALTLASARVTIPCKVESFNAAIAASVLMYEAARQSSPAFVDTPPAPPSVG